MIDSKSRLHSRGVFVVSLDFELYWGLRNERSLKEYKKNILGVRAILPRLLDYLVAHEIHVTWATVGFLFFDSKKELAKNIPLKTPACKDPNENPYEYLKNIGEDELEDPYHFGLSLIKKIIEAPFQEIGTHTFAHFTRWGHEQYDEFLFDDLIAAKQVAENLGIKLKSLVFPQNRYNEACLNACEEAGINSYRGNLDDLEWGPLRNLDIDHILVRGKRFLDSLSSFFPHRVFDLEYVSRSYPFNIPSSRFFQPYHHSLRFLEPFKLRRMMSEMTHAAEKGLIYHIWFHPHNFGINQEKNMDKFKIIVEHFLNLNQKYGMKSLSMTGVAELAEAYAKKEACTVGE
jgi:hypothetical protein